MYVQNVVDVREEGQEITVIEWVIDSFSLLYLLVEVYVLCQEIRDRNRYYPSRYGSRYIPDMDTRFLLVTLVVLR